MTIEIDELKDKALKEKQTEIDLLNDRLDWMNCAMRSAQVFMLDGGREPRAMKSNSARFLFEFLDPEFQKRRFESDRAMGGLILDRQTLTHDLNKREADTICWLIFWVCVFLSLLAISAQATQETARVILSWSFALGAWGGLFFARKTIKKLLLIPLAFLAIGCTEGNQKREARTQKEGDGLPAGIDRFHDDKNGVTCWEGRKYAIFCLPDKWLAGGEAPKP